MTSHGRQLEKHCKTFIHTFVYFSITPALSRETAFVKAGKGLTSLNIPDPFAVKAKHKCTFLFLKKNKKQAVPVIQPKWTWIKTSRKHMKGPQSSLPILHPNTLISHCFSSACGAVLVNHIHSALCDNTTRKKAVSLRYCLFWKRKRKKERNHICHFMLGWQID